MRAIADGTGGFLKQSIYKPFGAVIDWVYSAGLIPETKGFIGERYDADAGLQYLNARYYDPELGLFIQPDWFEVTKAGVGTNRYSYSGNDPVNSLDPGGNASCGSSLSSGECEVLLSNTDGARHAMTESRDAYSEILSITNAGGRIGARSPLRKWARNFIEIHGNNSLNTRNLQTAISEIDKVFEGLDIERKD